jgi:hypothetical protein
MNFPGINWGKNLVKAGTQYAELHSKFLGYLHDQGFSQLVEAPTRGDNTLDIFTTNNRTVINKVQVIPGIGDHDGILIEADIAPTNPRHGP